MVESIEIGFFPTIPPPDLELCVQIDHNNARKLYFSIHSRAIGYIFADFGDITLKSSPLEKMQAVYAQLNYMTGRPPRSPEEKIFSKRRLETLGNDLWDELIPAEFKQEYWKFKDRVKSFLITSDEPWIPWEMIKPYRFDNDQRKDEPFWCERFAMSRWLSGPGPVAQLYVGAAQPVAPDEVNLAAVKDEVTFLRTLNTYNAGISTLETLSNRSDVIKWIEQEKFSIMHFACHGSFDTTLPNESAIKLSDGPLCPSDIRARFAGSRPRPLVFMNACHGARIDFGFTGLGGWAAQLLEARVGIFIGAMWEVTDELALQFTRSFYSKLLKENKTSAQAFQEARKEIRQLAPYDSTWLAYVLYADPNSRIQDLERQEKITLQDLLLRLQTTIEDDEELDTEDRAEALEQFQVLISCGQNPDDAAIKKSAKTAAKILRGTASTIPTDSLFAEACNTILPVVTTLLDI